MSRKVTFLPSNITVSAEDGEVISSVAKSAGLSISTPCGGDGRCGRCLVAVEGKGNVLACKTLVDGDMTVTIPEDTGKVVAAKDYSESVLDDFTPLSDGLGVAVDIGTTTVALDVLDMSDGHVISSAADVNGQKRLGDDVLARIQYASEGGTEELRSLVLKTIDNLIDTSSKDIDRSDITSVYIAGNTVMEHLFLGVDPTPIRCEPYEPVVKEAEITGEESGLNIPPSAKVVTMPCISAYVGGDITSDIVFSGMDRSEGICLLIDVGTNGEVALGNADLMIVCSSSAGPAFEGGNLKSGMLAKPGAIDSVHIDGSEIRYTVIGDTEPKGVCGSGIIDLISQLFKAGFIDKRGNFTEISGAVDGTFVFANNISISEAEIKDVIMTKAAIYSAAKSLVRNIGLDFNDLDKVYIAGGFGNYIDMESAITMGMFPDVPRDKYVYLGNSSLAGARSALLSETFRNRISYVFQRMTYLDLSSDPVFYDEYMSAQFLPHTDSAQFPSVRY